MLRGNAWGNQLCVCEIPGRFVIGMFVLDLFVQLKSKKVGRKARGKRRLLICVLRRGEKRRERNIIVVVVISFSHLDMMSGEEKSKKALKLKTFDQIQNDTVYEIHLFTSKKRDTERKVEEDTDEQVSAAFPRPIVSTRVLFRSLPIRIMAVRTRTMTWQAQWMRRATRQPDKNNENNEKFEKAFPSNFQRRQPFSSSSDLRLRAAADGSGRRSIETDGHLVQLSDEETQVALPRLAQTILPLAIGLFNLRQIWTRGFSLPISFFLASFSSSFV